MALQPIDRSKAKHAIKTMPRKVPSLVNRTNKRVLPELVPQHALLSRFQGGWNAFYQQRDWW